VKEAGGRTALFVAGAAVSVVAGVVVALAAAKFGL
jgi:hypothetical protein